MRIVQSDLKALKERGGRTERHAARMLCNFFNLPVPKWAMHCEDDQTAEAAISQTNAEIFAGFKLAICPDCLNTFHGRRNQTYCPLCAKRRRRVANTARMRKQRELKRRCGL